MRYCLILAFICSLAAAAHTQTPFLSEFYDTYKQKEHTTDVKLQGWLLKLAAEQSEEAPAGQLLNKISYLRVLLMEEANLVPEADYRQLLRNLRRNAFEELLFIQEGSEKISLYIREDGKHITDVLVLVNGADSFVLLSLEGMLRFSDLNDLNIDIEGAEHFERLPDNRKDIPRA